MDHSIRFHLRPLLTSSVPVHHSRLSAIGHWVFLITTACTCHCMSHPHHPGPTSSHDYCSAVKWLIILFTYRTAQSESLRLTESDGVSSVKDGSDRRLNNFDVWRALNLWQRLNSLMTQTARQKGHIFWSLSVCVDIWSKKEWPKDWTKLVLLPVPKTGNKQDIRYDTIR